MIELLTTEAAATWLQWLLEHIYILLVFYINKIKSFFNSIREHFKLVDETLIKLTAVNEQHEIRLQNLEKGHKCSIK